MNFYSIYANLLFTSLPIIRGWEDLDKDACSNRRKDKSQDISVQRCTSIQRLGGRIGLFYPNGPGVAALSQTALY